MERTPEIRQGNEVLTGIDVLLRSRFEPLAGKRIGLVTNQTGRSRSGTSTVELFSVSPAVTLTALFGPEHGFRGVQDEEIEDELDRATGLPVYSLFGSRARPAEEQCAAIDLFVFDIQDIGCRFYTYLSTLGNVMEAAVEFGKEVYVLDRPNPITGVSAGPLPDPNRLSFTAYHPIPVRHGLTMGEIARLIHLERGLSCPLHVEACEGWARVIWYDETGLPWVNPSPNMRSLRAALLYPGIGLLEFTNLSVGRGTDRPFEIVGAPYLDGVAVAQEINDKHIPGVRADPIEFIPSSSVFCGEHCRGVSFTVTDRNELDPIRLGIELAALLIQSYPDSYSTAKLDTLLVSHAVHGALIAQASVEDVQARWKSDLQSFRERTQRIKLY